MLWHISRPQHHVLTLSLSLSLPLSLSVQNENQLTGIAAAQSPACLPLRINPKLLIKITFDMFLFFARALTLSTWQLRKSFKVRDGQTDTHRVFLDHKIKDWSSRSCFIATNCFILAKQKSSGIRCHVFSKRCGNELSTWQKKTYPPIYLVPRRQVLVMIEGRRTSCKSCQQFKDKEFRGGGKVYINAHRGLTFI